MTTSAPTRHVLIVDDEPELRQLLADALSEPGLEITAAASGSAALQAARDHRPDLIVTDLCLGDCTGVEVLDELGRTSGDIPAIVITGQADADALSLASRRRPVELMTKPLDISRLKATVHDELGRQQRFKQTQDRTKRLRRLARENSLQGKRAQRQLQTTCADLSQGYRQLGEQLAMTELVLEFQNTLVGAQSDDDVFRELFRLFVRHSGGVFGAALVCDANAQLRVAGRFGVPTPDNLKFCQTISTPVIDMLLTKPQVTTFDATEQVEKFDASIRRRLVGVSVLAIPLSPADRELIGVVVLYRKGEQPFLESDVKLAEMIARPTALAVRRND